MTEVDPHTATALRMLAEHIMRHDHPGMCPIDISGNCARSKDALPSDEDCIKAIIEWAYRKAKQP